MQALTKEKLRRFLLPFYRPLLHPPFTSPIYFQLKNIPRSRLARWLHGSLAWNYELVVLERVVEIPFVFQNLALPKGSKVLDFGCNGSPVCLHLASLGYRVMGVDLHPYPFRHPNLRFVQGDFLQNEFADGEFDAVIAISAVEHCGLGRYGEDRDERGDHKIVREFSRVLCPGGLLLLTVPYGRAGETSWYRVYDKAGIEQLLVSFKIHKREYYRGVDRKQWMPTTEEEVATVDSVECGYARGVVCIVAVKS